MGEPAANICRQSVQMFALSFWLREKPALKMHRCYLVEEKPSLKPSSAWLVDPCCKDPILKAKRLYITPYHVGSPQKNHKPKTAWTFACMRAVFSPASYLFSQLLLLFEATPGGLSLSVGRCFGRAVEGESLCSNSRA